VFYAEIALEEGAFYLNGPAFTDRKASFAGKPGR